MRRGTRYLTRVAVTAALAAAAACASTGFNSTWRNPDAQPAHPEGQKVAALVMSRVEANRRVAEDTLAGAITNAGAQGVPVYTLSDSTDEATVRAVLEREGFAGLVVMRPVGSRQELNVTPSMYAGPPYRGFWGGYWGYGWGAAWGPPAEVHTDTIVTVETLVYSLKQNALLWAGQSQTSNPGRVDSFVKEVAAAAAKELRKQGVIGQP